MEALLVLGVAAINTSFMLLLFGTGLATIIVAWLSWGTGDPGWTNPMAALVYVLGCIGVTIAGNVPLNNALASSRAKSAWSGYYVQWTFWNHARTLACFGSALLLGFGLIRGE